MKEMKFYGATDMGKLRTNNEDAFVAQYIWTNRYVLCIAIDGVGGYEGGEVAAQIAQEYITKHLAELLPDNPLEALKEAVVEANNRIYEARQHDTKRPSMGCVLSAGIIELDNNVIDVVHVGDSRIYRYQGNAFDKITHDHSLVGYREEIGELTEIEAMNHPQRNVIDRLLGDALHTTTERGFFEASKYPLDENTQLLFCSDGLTDLVTRAEMMDILDQQISIEEKTKQLIDKANEKGGKDNITVVLAIAENKFAQPKKTVVEAPKPNQRQTKLKKTGDGMRKNNKVLWGRVTIALFISIMAFVAGNIMADKGIISLTNKKPMYYTDSVQTLNVTIDSLQKNLKESNDSILVLHNKISDLSKPVKK